MNSIERVKQRIAQVIAGSTVPEDPLHSTNTLAWLLKIDPNADVALQIAALGHDIERAVKERRIRRADFEDFDEFKAAHARNSAEILRETMRECGVEDEALMKEVHRLVCRHEGGGDPRSDLLKDADGISYFDVNLPFYHGRNHWKETQRRCIWGYLRLSEVMKAVAAQIVYPDDELKQIMAESIKAAEALRRVRA